MSCQRSSINDYPEHLNPFYEGDKKTKFLKIGKVKRSSSFGEALRNTLLFKSIRGKKKKQQVNTPSSPPELRRNEAKVEMHYRQTLPTIVSPSPSPSRVSVPVPLPRSRFSERVPKLNNQHDNSTLSANPFEEDNVLKGDSARLKRPKRRAPLPPNSEISYGTSSISSTHNSSKWSIASEATDISAYSDNEQSHTHAIDPSVSLNISNIVKEIEKLSEVHLSESKGTDVPDVVLSLTESTVQCKDCDQNTDENFNVVPETCDKDTVEDTCPDVLCNTNCSTNLNEEIVSEDDKEEVLQEGSDSLTNLINSIELNNDNKLEDKSDSLTNIINSINMIENECYKAPESVSGSLKDEITITNINLEETSEDELETRKKSMMVNPLLKNELGSDLAVT